MAHRTLGRWPCSNEFPLAVLLAMAEPGPRGLPPVAEIRLCSRGREAERAGSVGALWSALPSSWLERGEPWVGILLGCGAWGQLWQFHLRPPVVYRGGGDPLLGVGERTKAGNEVGVTCFWDRRDFSL